MNEIEKAAKTVLSLADELYQFGRNGQSTTEEDSVKLESDIMDIRYGKRHIKVVITERMSFEEDDEDA